MNSFTSNSFGDDKILILGASSYLGDHFRRHLPESLGTYNNRRVDGAVKFNSLTDELSSVVQDLESYSHALIFLGDTNPDTCIADEKRSEELNVLSIQRALQNLKEANVFPVFTSTEQMFDGERGNYTEEDEPSPILLYAQQKLRVERFIQREFDRYLIFRVAKIYGGYTELRGSLFTGMLDQLSRETTLQCASDQYFSPVHVEDIFTVIMSAIGQDLSGLFHLSGNERWSRLDLLKLTRDSLNEYREIDPVIHECSIDDFELPERRPKDISLVSNKVLQALDLKLRSVKERCQEITKEFIQQ